MINMNLRPSLVQILARANSFYGVLLPCASVDLLGKVPAPFLRPHLMAIMPNKYLQTIFLKIDNGSLFYRVH